MTSWHLLAANSKLVENLNQAASTRCCGDYKEKLSTNICSECASVHSCSVRVPFMFHSRSLVFICVPFVFTRVHSCSIRVHLCSIRVHSCSFVLRSCSLVFICVLFVFICVLFVFHSCSLVFICVPFVFHSRSLVFIRVPFVFTRVHSCSIHVHSCLFVFQSVWCFRYDLNHLLRGSAHAVVICAAMLFVVQFQVSKSNYSSY